MNIRSTSKVEVECAERYQRCSGVSGPVLQMRHVPSTVLNCTCGISASDTKSIASMFTKGLVEGLPKLDQSLESFAPLCALDVYLETLIDDHSVLLIRNVEDHAFAPARLPDQGEVEPIEE